VQPPDELMVQSFLPAMRQLVARDLSVQKFSQNRISSMLGITQASVSLYLSRSPSKAYSFLAKLGMSSADAERCAALITESTKKGPVDAVSTLNSIWTDLLGSGAVCPSHREVYPSLAECDVCIKEFGQRGGERSKTIAEVAGAVKLLEASRSFASVMPEVSVNLACAADRASSPADVIAVPGRIVKVKGRPRSMLPPEAGASMHMSSILLMVRERRPDLRACINLRYDKKVARLLVRLGLKALIIGTHQSRGAEDPTVEALRRRLDSHPPRFDVVVDEGGSGIEPNVYLFGADAGGVAESALRLSGMYAVG
jgi:XRE family transcriptional regulator, thiamine biosynthesis regulator